MGMLNIGPKNLLDEKPSLTVIVSKEIPESIIQIVEKEVIKYIEVPVEIIKEVPIQIIRIEKEYVEIPVEKIVEVIKEVPYKVEVLIERLITQEVKYVPKWIWGIMLLELLIIIFK